jgi:hypothetical protein
VRVLPFRSWLTASRPVGAQTQDRVAALVAEFERPQPFAVICRDKASPRRASGANTLAALPIR